jgi:hypothetical protein
VATQTKNITFYEISLKCHIFILHQCGWSSQSTSPYLPVTKSSGCIYALGYNNVFIYKTCEKTMMNVVKCKEAEAGKSKVNQT